MKPNKLFLKLPKRFWANVRLISQEVGYTQKGTRKIKIPSDQEIRLKLQKVGINFDDVLAEKNGIEHLNELLQSYFEHRASVLNNFVEPRLMDAQKARQTFESLREKFNPTRPIPMNKQKGAKKASAYLTGIVNILIEANSQGLPCDYDPRHLTTIMKNNLPVRTLARRVDGAFPGSVNPIAVWEIKEYYYTTTFGSRVADGIYESLLDGMELEELKEHEDIDVKHYLMVDAYDTWWKQGKSYLCRIIDMLHMGYMDEVLFGYEVVERLPAIVQEWVKIAKSKN